MFGKNELDSLLEDLDKELADAPFTEAKTAKTLVPQRITAGIASFVYKFPNFHW